MIARWWALGAAAVLPLGACAGFAGRPAPPPEADAALPDSGAVVDPTVIRQVDGALGMARWRLLRALDEEAAGRYDGARDELDQALRALATVDDSPLLDGAQADSAVQSRVDSVAAAVEHAYLGILPNLEHLSPDSPLSMLLAELEDEQLQRLPADAVPLVRIHQMAPRCDIPIDANARVAASIYFFETRGRATFLAWLRRSGRYRDLILPVLRESGLPEDLLYLAMIESGFNPRAYSRAAASGLWQFIRATGRLEGLAIDNWVDERRDPLKSTRAAAQHLKGLYAEFGDWRLAAAAYNAGKGRVQRAIDKAGSRDFWVLELPAETRNYVPLLMAAAVIAKDPARFGFEVPPLDEPLTWDPVKVDEPVDLATAARLLGIQVQALRDLNPELRQAFTPYRPRTGYLLNVPSGQGASFLAAYEDLPRSARRGVYEYVVQRGDNLSTISRTFGVKPGLLAEANGLGKGNLIRPGQRLFIPVAGGGQPSAPAGGGTYTVRRGDNLSAISHRFGVSVADLQRWNGLAGSVIRPGQRLRVSAAPVLAARNRAPIVAADGRRRVHTVRRGESLWSIARQHDVSVTQLQAWNRLHGETIRPGASLYVAPAAGAVRSYTVVRGDTLYGIARRFGVDAEAIARRNNLSLSSTLLTGMQLRIPTPQPVD